MLLRVVDPEILGVGLVTEHRLPEPEAAHPGLVGVDREQEGYGRHQDDGEGDADQCGHRDGVDDLE